MLAHAGRGVFSNVVKCKDQHRNLDVALKFIRSNPMMRTAAKKEVQLLAKLNEHDKDDKRNIVRLYRTFQYRNHYCLVFEMLWNNLRYALKKYGGGGKGLSMGAVWSYSRQLFIALRFLKKFDVVHADLKPDNILINNSYKVLKLADLGSAVYSGECDVTSYFVSRFYRAPEVILGMAYGIEIDMWSAACTIFEIFCGKILFAGKSNNDMIRLHMDVQGAMPSNMLNEGKFTDKHFNIATGAFLWQQTDKDKNIVGTTELYDLKPTKDITMRIISRAEGDEYKTKKAQQLADLLKSILNK